MSGDLNMGNKQIINIGYNINNPGDVVNLGFTDQKYLQKVSDSDLDMDDHRIKNSLEPVNSRDLTTKNYVDNQMGTKADLSKTTTQTFQGRVQVPNFSSGSYNGSDIVNLKYINNTFLNKKTGGSLGNSISFISSLPSNQRQIFNLAPPQFSSSATSKSYVDGEIAKIPQPPQVNTSQFIKKDGTVAMTADMDLGGNKITNLKSPTDDTDGSTKQYVDQKISEYHVETSDKTNVFKYLNDAIQTSSERNIVVNSFGDWTNSPHKYNKRAYDVTLQRHAGADSYNSIIGFNLYSAGAGKFTLVFEFHYPNVMSNTSIKASQPQQSLTKKHKEILLIT